MTETRDNTENKKRFRPKLLLVKIALAVFMLTGLIVVCVAEIALPKDTDTTGYSCEEFTPQWSQVLEDGERVPVEIPGKLEGEKGETFVIETKVPEKLAKAGYLCVKSSRQDVKIYVGDELRASYSSENKRLFGKSSTSYYVFAKFAVQDEGKTLTIKYTTDSAYSGIIKNMYYGSQAGIWIKLFSMFGLELCLGVLLVLFAIICVILGIVIRIAYKESGKNGDLIYLGWGELLAGIWVLSQSPFRQIIWRNVSVFGDLSFYALMLLPLPFLIYMNEVQEERYRLFYRIASGLSVATTVICCTLQVFNIVDMHESLIYVFAVLLLCCVLFAVTTLLDIKNKRIDSYIHVAIGLIGLVVGGTAQAVIYLLRPIRFGATSLCLGFLFMLSMAVIRLVKVAAITENERLEAIQANKLQEEFLANMSHEIRTPLNAIIGLNEMVLKESGEESIKSYASDIKGASKTLLGLINDILDFSKIESGKVDLQPVKYWTTFLLTDSYNLILKRAEERNVELKVEADPACPEQLFGDETRIRQIITNLLTNSVKYTNEGSITIRLHWRKTSIETAMIRISVADTGIGIKPEDQEKLFHSFQRVDEKRNRNVEGTGLGLVISKQLVELMGGRIWVKSVYGEGSEFFFEIPQKIVSEKGMGEFSPHAAGSDDVILHSATNFTAPDARILVVDDVETNLKVIKNLLKDTEIHIETATGGQECLDMTKNTGYDLVFLDHRMPEMDGIETLHHMRERKDDPNEETPVIMLTANVVAGAKENYLREGFTDYLTKPIRQSDLKQMLMDYLPLHKVHKEDA